MIFLALWMALGLLGAGWTNAYFGRKFDSVAEPREDIAFALMFAFLGPICAFVAFFLSGFGQYGWSLRCPPANRGDEHG